MGGALQALLKRAVKKALWGPPRKTVSGHDSYIARPRLISGSAYLRMGDRTTIGKHGWIWAVDNYAGIRHSPQIVLGHDVHIGRYVCITAIDSVVIEDGCLLSEHVYISDHGHGLDPNAGLLVDRPLVSKGPVHIGAHTFIGYRASVLPGVTLGKNCVVGANSVVTRDFPDHSMVAGCPARLIKTYSPELKTWSAELAGATFA